ncbi:MAG TPA: hypothetical protein VFE79_13960 [Paraburkholderia sp.]|nr:hypothetical protein [Paraburkholderia sp.]
MSAEAATCPGDMPQASRMTSICCRTSEDLKRMSDAIREMEKKRLDFDAASGMAAGSIGAQRGSGCGE